MSLESIQEYSMRENGSRNFVLTIERKRFNCSAVEDKCSLGRSVRIEIVHNGSSRSLWIFRWFSYLDNYEDYVDKSASELIDLAIERLKMDIQKDPKTRCLDIERLKIEMERDTDVFFSKVCTAIFVMNGSGKEFDRWNL